MTTRASLSSLALVAVFAGRAGGLSAQNADQANTAKGVALMAEARKAIGGEDKLRGVKAVQVNGKFKRTAGNNTLEGDFEVYIEPPGKYKRHEETGTAGGPIGERTEVLNGAETWDETSNGFPAGRGFFGRGRGAPDGAPAGDGAARQGGQGGGRAGGQPIDPERLKELQRRQRQAELARLMLVWFLTTDAPVSWVGTAESPDGNADVIEVKPMEGSPTRVFLDTATHMPLMLTTTGFGGRGRRGGAPGGQGGDAGRGGAAPQITIETHLSEYKTVGGIKLPHLITRGVNGQTNEEWEIKTYRINPNFKANTFTK